MRPVTILTATLLASSCHRDLEVGTVEDASAGTDSAPPASDGSPPTDLGNDGALDAVILPDNRPPDLDAAPVAPSPSLIADRSSQSFGILPGGLISSAPIVVAIINNGDAPTGALTASLDGPDNAEFRIAGETCTAVLKPGDRCEVTLRFAPFKGASAGQRSATLRVDDPLDKPVRVLVPLQGTVSSGDAYSFSPANLTFADTVVGRKTPVLNITATNLTNIIGTVNVDIQPRTTTSFVRTDDRCEARNLAAGDSCTVSLVFAPGSAGMKDEVLVLSGSQGMARLSLLGRAVPAVEVLPVAQDFGMTAPGARSVQRMLSVFVRGPFSSVSTRVLGEFVATPAPPTLTGPGCLDFSTVAADDGASWRRCMTAVTFQPTGSPGTRTGALEVVVPAGGMLGAAASAKLTGTAGP